MTTPNGAFVVRGKRYPIPDRFTLGDGRVFRRMGVEFRQGMKEVDFANPDALAALVMISMRRAGETVTEDDIDALGVEEIVFEAPEGEVADDPPVDAPQAAEANGASAPKGAEPSGETTREISGHPA